MLNILNSIGTRKLLGAFYNIMLFKNQIGTYGYRGRGGYIHIDKLQS